MDLESKYGMTRQGLEERLKKIDYDVAGFQVYTRSVGEVQESLEFAKRANPDVITLIGGSHPSGDPEGSLTFMNEAYELMKRQRLPQQVFIESYNTGRAKICAQGRGM